MKPNPLLDELADADEIGESGETEGADDEADSGEATPDMAGGEASCAPAEAFAPACGTCLAGSCCELVFACEQVEDCTCLASCILDGGNAGSCRKQCNGASADDIAELEPVLACSDAFCGSTC